MKISKAICLSILSLVFWVGSVCAFNVTGFSNPYGLAIDQKTGFIYVSNVNGDLDATDDNGFISRLKSDGTVDQLRFVDGASPDIILHAPTGMTVLGNFIYVCDIDKLHVYNAATGMQLFDVNFGDLPRQHFYAIIVGPDGALYVADAGVNTIYRIDVTKQHEVTVFVASEDLGGPHGMVWYPGRQIFVVSGGTTGQLSAYDKSGKRQQIPAMFLKTLEGLDIDDAGNIYIASRGLNAAYRVATNFALYGYRLGLTGPTGVAYNRPSQEIIVTNFDGNTVLSYPVTK